MVKQICGAMTAEADVSDAFKLRQKVGQTSALRPFQACGQRVLVHMKNALATDPAIRMGTTTMAMSDR